MQLAPDLDTGPAQLGRGGVCEGCAAEPLALLQRREKQAAARHPVGRVWPFSRCRPARVAACGRLVGGEQPQPAWGCSGGSGGQVVPLAQSRKGAERFPLKFFCPPLALRRGLPCGIDPTLCSSAQALGGQAWQATARRCHPIRQSASSLRQSGRLTCLLGRGVWVTPSKHHCTKVTSVAPATHRLVSLVTTPGTGQVRPCYLLRSHYGPLTRTAPRRCAEASSRVSGAAGATRSCGPMSPRDRWATPSSQRHTDRRPGGVSSPRDGHRTHHFGGR